MVAAGVLLRRAGPGNADAGVPRDAGIGFRPVGRRKRSQMGRTVSACGPFAPWLASKETRWFSSRVRNPSD